MPLGKQCRQPLFPSRHIRIELLGGDVDMLDFYLEILSSGERVALLGHIVIRNRYAEIVL